MENQIKALLDDDSCLSGRDAEKLNGEIQKLVGLLHKELPYGQVLSIPDFIDTIKKATLLVRELLSNKDISVVQYNFLSDRFEPIGDAVSFFGGDASIHYRSIKKIRVD